VVADDFDTEFLGEVFKKLFRPPFGPVIDEQFAALFSDLIHACLRYRIILVLTGRRCIRKNPEGEKQKDKEDDSCTGKTICFHVHTLLFILVFSLQTTLKGAFFINPYNKFHRWPDKSILFLRSKTTHHVYCLGDLDIMHCHTMLGVKITNLFHTYYLKKAM
jgi:hypothetical protein